MGIGRIVNELLRRRIGWEFRPAESVRFNSEEFAGLFERYRDATMVQAPAAFVLYNAINYIERSKLSGSIVECGVYKGGLCGMAAELLKGTDREIYLFDTFTGMSQPSDADFRIADSLPASAKFHDGWCEGPLQVVRAVMARSGFSEDQIHYVVGKVEETLPEFDAPDIAVLRLDTDFYESTKAELDHLYDHVVPGGVVIVDDYSIWAGSRKAVDDFLASRNLHPLMHFEPSVGGISFVKP